MKAPRPNGSAARRAGSSNEKSFDFRVGGREPSADAIPAATVSAFDCIYRDIVEPEGGGDGRIIYSYVMHLDGRKISVSQACIQIAPGRQRLQADGHRAWRFPGWL